ncbi:MAG: hypothetical protein AAB757_02075 [Patescibacteria group bacterium]
MEDKSIKKRIMIFSGIAAAIVIILAIAAYFAVNFMKEITITTSEARQNKTPIIKFSFDKLKEIGIIKD